MQIWLGKNAEPGPRDILWWKTYSPPVWLSNQKAGASDSLKTIDLMGIPIEEMMTNLKDRVGSCDDDPSKKQVIVVAPRSRTDLDPWTTGTDTGESEDWEWTELWTEWRHLNLDDIDLGQEGVMGTWKRVIGRRGLTAWKVGRRCR